MGQVDAKKEHKSGSFPLSESGKSSVGKGGKKKVGTRNCTICKQPGHIKTKCRMQAPSH